MTRSGSSRFAGSTLRRGVALLAFAVFSAFGPPAFAASDGLDRALVALDRADGIHPITEGAFSDDGLRLAVSQHSPAVSVASVTRRLFAIERTGADVRRVEGSEQRRLFDSGRIVDVVRQTHDGVQFAAVLSSKQSGSSLTYRFRGADLVANRDGTVTVSVDGISVGIVAAAWAVDAGGAALPTGYRIAGDSLTQTVDVSDAVYPVVTDPYVTFGKWVYVTFTKSDVRRIWSTIRNAPLSEAIGIVCARIPHPAVVVGCVLMAVWMYNSIKSTFEAAHHLGRCVRFHFHYGVLFSPQPPSDWYVYRC